MGYFVRPEALDSYATLVERNGINLSLTNVHLGGESELGNVEGIWIQHLVGAHTQTVDRMLSSVAQGFHQLGASADELKRTAAYYVRSTRPRRRAWTPPTPRRRARHSRRLCRV